MLTAQAADIAVSAHRLCTPKTKIRNRWYEHFDFEPSPTDPFHLFLLLKDLKGLLKLPSASRGTEHVAQT
jgi:hypothetical protein